MTVSQSTLRESILTLATVSQLNTKQPETHLSQKEFNQRLDQSLLQCAKSMKTSEADFNVYPDQADLMILHELTRHSANHLRHSTLASSSFSLIQSRIEALCIKHPELNKSLNNVLEIARPISHTATPTPLAPRS
tara:strand:+ start:206 stop:610 length:405 start_codon:yes stop_codon:yes gene_type:complete